MNSFLKKFEPIILLLSEKNILYEINNSITLAPSFTFQAKNSKYKIQMELRDSLECTIYENNIITNTIPVYNETGIEIRNHFEKILNERTGVKKNRI
jgi:hypothetical protein